jgi:hypothetical protein
VTHTWRTLRCYQLLNSDMHCCTAVCSACSRLRDLRSMLALRADQAGDGGGEAVEVLCGLIEGMLR